MDGCDVCDLTSELLMLCADAAISIDHNNVPFSIETNCSLFLCYHYAVFWVICKRFGGKISTLFAKVCFGTELKIKTFYCIIF